MEQSGQDKNLQELLHQTISQVIDNNKDDQFVDRFINNLFTNNQNISLFSKFFLEAVSKGKQKIVEKLLKLGITEHALTSDLINKGFEQAYLNQQENIILLFIKNGLSFTLIDNDELNSVRKIEIEAYIKEINFNNEYQQFRVSYNQASPRRQAKKKQ